MAYATLADITTLQGEDALLLVATDPETGTVAIAAVERALVSATSLIDTHVGVRYRVPLVVVPELMRDICIDIALYKLSGVGTGLNDEARTRYEDALALLKRIAEGKANLDLPPTATEAPVRAGRAAIVAGRRMFTRDKLRGY